MTGQRSPMSTAPSDHRANHSMGFGAALLNLMARIERQDTIDPLARAAAIVARPLAEGAARPVLAGRWLGHALHPLLTDFPLGSWMSASFLDLFGGRAARPASRRLTGFGIVTAVPTAAAGLSDWAHVERSAQRVGLIHAAANSTALALYTASYLARRGDRHARAVFLGVLGGIAAIAGGYLGGHLTLTAAVTKDNALIDHDRNPITPQRLRSPAP